ncbi:hypothetical protein M2160_007771 [Streptomyces sp. SAI-117]|nr:hypothetical protein [Streptomyces sp. SAI-041]MDH6572750.1 hypothetical protein [Streptomyces sp. SAI-117]MDH6582288.1 hypothetical protein [Streptomyces sp. SAI-133]
MRAHIPRDMESTEASAEVASEPVRQVPALPTVQAMLGSTRLDKGALTAARAEAQYAGKRPPLEPPRSI